MVLMNPMRRQVWSLPRCVCWMVLLSLGGMAGCDQQSGKPATATGNEHVAVSDGLAGQLANAPDEGKDMKPEGDVVERTSAYLIGIHYPADLDRYPGLAQLVRRYAGNARAELMEVVRALGNDQPPAPYELSLRFTMPLETSRLVLVTADGSRYTGGAHGEPLIARFVWLPQSEQLLDAKALIPSAEGWAAVSAYVAEHLHAQAEARAVAGDLAEGERNALVDSADRMIAEGAGPDPENFSRFEPLLNADGLISSLRFVFLPYQVGPYSDGAQSVDVPASVLRPWVSARFQALFVE